MLNARKKCGFLECLAGPEGIILAYIDHTNTAPKPFVWTKTADEILASVRPILSSNLWGKDTRMFLLILLVVASALGQPIQIAANNRLREAVQSPVLSALIGFLVGGTLLAILILSGLFERGELRGLRNAPWWAWVGGLLAVFSVMAGIVALPRMSSATIIAAAVFGQLVASMVIDHFGWLNVPVVPINRSRIIGAVLLFIGALLMRRT